MRSIIIAKYTENKDWIGKIPNGWNIHLYDKDKNMENAPGREAHTYFKFIVDNYDSLDGDYVFCQGNPFDHCPTFLEELYNGVISGKEYPFDRISFINQEQTRTELYIKSLGLTVPDIWDFSAGAQFKTTSERIKKNPKWFYQYCLNLTLTDPQSGYIFEGLWKFIL